MSKHASQIILFNKPYNVLSQFTDDAKRPCLADYIPIPGVYAAGRLDLDSEGLLVLTNNGALQHKISHPAAKLSKTYWVQVEGQPTSQSLAPLRQGLMLKDGPCAPVKWQLGLPIDSDQLWPRDPPIRTRRTIPTSWLTLTLTEGRNRQVRRMCAALGFPVLRLIRYRVGSWTVDGIACGTWRNAND